jgi:hypothetical protein
MYPALCAKISHITVMGGTFVDYGNTSPTAEFNIRCDPEAAAIVLESGLPIRLYPLDPFRALRIARHEFEHFIACTDTVAQTAGRIMRFSANHFGIDHALLGDAGAVATVLEPDGATVQRLPITVELTGRVSRGQTVIDRRNALQRSGLAAWCATSPAEVDVVSTVDTERYRARFARAIGAPWPRGFWIASHPTLAPFMRPHSHTATRPLSPLFLFLQHAVRDGLRQRGRIAPGTVVGDDVEQGVLGFSLEDEGCHIEHHVAGMLCLSDLGSRLVEWVGHRVRFGILDVRQRQQPCDDFSIGRREAPSAKVPLVADGRQPRPVAEDVP